MRELAAGATKYAIGGVLARVVSVVSVPIYLRFLSASEYGVQAIALLNEQILLIVAGYAMVNALGMHLFGERPADDEGQGVVVGSAFWSVCALGIAVAAVWQLAAEGVSALTLDGSQSSTLVVRLIGISFLFSLFFNLALTIWQLSQRVLLYSAVNIGKFALSVGLSVLFLSWSLGVVGIILGWTIASVVTGLVSIAWLRYTYRLRFDGRMARRLAVYGVPLVPAALLTVVLNGSDRYILKLFGGLDAVGVYATAYVLASACNFLLITPFRQAWPAMMWKMRRLPDESSFHRSALRYYTAFQVFAIIAITVFAVPAMWVVSSGKPEFVSASLAVPVIYVGFVLGGAYDVLSAGYFFAGRTIYYTLTVILSTAANVALNLVLVPPLGLWGSAVSFALSYLLYAVLSAVFGRRFFRPGHDWRMVAAAVAIGSVACAAYAFALTGGSVVAFAVGLMSIGLLPLALVRTGVVSVGEMRSAAALFLALSRSRIARFRAS